MNCLKLLIEHKGDINLQNRDHITPLMFSAYCRNADCIELLLANKADLSKVDLKGRTAFEIAKVSGCGLPILVSLLEHETSRDEEKIMNYKTSIFRNRVMRKEDFTGAIKLLNEGVDINTPMETFHFMCMDKT